MSKRIIAPYRLLSAQDLSSSFVSASTHVQLYDRIAYSVSWTGTAVGRLIAQGSLDNINFSDLDMNPILMANATDTGILDIQATGVPFVRLSYTATSGAGSLDAFVSAKES